MTRSLFVFLFVIFVTIHQTVQLQCNQGEEEDPCPSDCYDYSCPTKERQNVKCTAPKECGPPRCKCFFNSKRAPNGTCIATWYCPPFKCDRPNEEYVACHSYCPTDDCKQSTPDGRCPMFGDMLMVIECEPACRCIKGYWRHNGLCVPYDQCPQHATILPIQLGL